jgi:hypothetical protein
MGIEVMGQLPEEHLVLARGGETFRFGPFSVHTIPALRSVNGLPNKAIPAGRVKAVGAAAD